jgi:hypothetical protein
MKTVVDHRTGLLAAGSRWGYGQGARAPPKQAACSREVKISASVSLGVAKKLLCLLSINVHMIQYGIRLAPRPNPESLTGKRPAMGLPVAVGDLADRRWIAGDAA